jgi:hypothetical protein
MVYDWEGKRTRRLRSFAWAAAIAVVLIAAAASFSDVIGVWW